MSLDEHEEIEVTEEMRRAGAAVIASVTPEMIKAGIAAWLSFNPKFEPEDSGVTRIYVAMELIRRYGQGGVS